MPADIPLSAPPAAAIRTWWIRTLVLAGSVLLARIAYLIWICPYELAADEAHYWEWSRRLDLSYYTKGPGVAWLIRASTALLGTAEWTVRLPAALASFACAMWLARLARETDPARPAAPFYSAALFMLAPVFHGSAQFMTIDAPYYACWALAALSAWRLARSPGSAAGYFLLGAIVGIGMLFKYTIILILPGLLWYLNSAHRPAPSPRWKRLMALAAGVMLLSSPIVIWNARHGWPTIAHLLGHAGLPGGDMHRANAWHYTPLWTLGYLAYPFILLGPPMGVLLLLTIRQAWRDRNRNPALWESVKFSLAVSLPILCFYLLLSLRTDIELNWGAAGYLAFMAPMASWLADLRIRSPAPRPLWKWTVAVGLIAGLILSFGKWPLDRIPPLKIGDRTIKPGRLLERVSGHKDLAARVEKLSRAVERQTGTAPFIMADSYGRASLLTFYMRTHPSVRSATSQLGGRRTAYDYFPDTTLDDPALLGRPAILVGTTAAAWTQAFAFETVVRSRSPGRIFAGYRYGGPIPHTPPPSGNGFTPAGR